MRRVVSIDLTFNDDPMLKAHWDWGFVWGKSSFLNAN
jgi:hypothetical protein